MSDIKCPFCQQELERVLQLACAGGLVEEAYLLCSKCDIRGERKLWQALIDTKKKLDIAVDALNRINCEMRKETIPDFAVLVDALKALEQINQKDKQ